MLSRGLFVGGMLVRCILVRDYERTASTLVYIEFMYGVREQELGKRTAGSGGLRKECSGVLGLLKSRKLGMVASLKYRPLSSADISQ